MTIYTLNDVAEMLDVTYVTIRKHVQRVVDPAKAHKTKKGHTHWLLDDSDVEAVKASIASAKVGNPNIKELRHKTLSKASN